MCLPSIYKVSTYNQIDQLLFLKVVCNVDSLAIDSSKNGVLNRTEERRITAKIYQPVASVRKHRKRTQQQKQKRL